MKTKLNKILIGRKMKPSMMIDTIFEIIEPTLNEDEILTVTEEETSFDWDYNILINEEPIAQIEVEFAITTEDITPINIEWLA